MRKKILRSIFYKFFDNFEKIFKDSSAKYYKTTTTTTTND